MIVKIISNKTHFTTNMVSVQLNEMLSLLTQMPGKYSIVVECDNDGQFRDPNNIIHRNFKSSFVLVPEPVVKRDLKPQVNKIETKKDDKDQPDKSYKDLKQEQLV